MDGFPRTTLEALAVASGGAFLEALAHALRQRLEATYVSLGALQVANHDRVRVVASSGFPAELDVTEYELCGAPCGQVIADAQRVIVPDNVRERFPRDTMLEALRVRSYVGVPLVGDGGRTIGLITVLGEGSLDEASTVATLESLAPILSRASAELDAQHRQDCLAELAAGTVEPTPPLQVLNRRVSESMLVRMSMVVEYTGEPDHLRIVALSSHGADRPEATGRSIAVAGAPCGRLISGEEEDLLISERLQAEFSTYSFFTEHGLHAYYGRSIRDSHGLPNGHMLLLHDRPLSERVRTSQLLDVFAERIRLEMIRRAADAQRRRFEEARQVQEKLESLGLLVGTVAHDFNNILAAALGFTEVALFDLEPGMPAHDEVETTRGCLLRARDLVQQLLDVAQSSDGLAVASMPLNPVVESALKHLPAERRASGRLRLQLEPELPDVRVDEAQIGQVVSNLVINALDAIDEGGEVVVRTALVELSEDDRRGLWAAPDTLPHRCVMLEVRDDGAGMDHHTARRVFDPFFTTKKEGRGLGMAAVQGVAKRHGAGLSLTSEPGVGTVVRMYLAV